MDLRKSFSHTLPISFSCSNLTTSLQSNHRSSRHVCEFHHEYSWNGFASFKKYTVEEQGAFSKIKFHYYSSFFPHRNSMANMNKIEFFQLKYAIKICLHILHKLLQINVLKKKGDSLSSILTFDFQQFSMTILKFSQFAMTSDGHFQTLSMIAYKQWRKENTSMFKEKKKKTLYLSEILETL